MTQEDTEMVTLLKDMIKINAVIAAELIQFLESLGVFKAGIHRLIFRIPVSTGIRNY